MNNEKKEAINQMHKQRIIDTAEKLFLEKGVAKTTMDDIAKSADYSKSTLYVYFKGKDEIYHSIIYNSMKILKECMRILIFPDMNIFERYYAACDALVDFQEKYPFYFESILGEIIVDEDTMKAQPVLYNIFLVGEEINEMMMQWIEDGIKEGVLREGIKLYQTVFVFWASISAIIRMFEQKSYYLEKVHHISKSEFLENSFEMLLQSILK